MFAEKINRTIRNFLKKPAFEEDNASCIDEKTSVLGKDDSTKTSSKLLPIQSTLKQNDEKVYKKL